MHDLPTGTYSPGPVSKAVDGNTTRDSRFMLGKFRHSQALEMSSDAGIEQNGNSDLLNKGCVSS